MKSRTKKNIGTIRSSNLCTEIMEYTAPDETAVCFTEDTEILTKNGIKRIIESDNEEVVVAFNSGDELIKNQRYIKAKLLKQGKKDVYELTLKGSRNIKATANHPFLVRTKRGRGKDKANRNSYEWKKLDELQAGDYLYSPKTKPVYDVDISKELNEEYLTIGWLLGDGWQIIDKNGRLTYGACFGETEIYAKDLVVNQLNSWHEGTQIIKGAGFDKRPKLYQDKNNVYTWSTSKSNFIGKLKNQFGFEEVKANDKKVYSKIKKCKV